jgi:transcriptional regulator with XRE-family HTH domain
MRLADYLEKTETKPSQFAEKAGLAPSTVTRLLNGERKPGLDVLEKIAAASEGNVKAEDFFSGTAQAPAVAAQ